MDAEQAKALREPFKPEQIGKLPKPTKKDNAKGRCMHRWAAGQLRHGVATWAHRRRGVDAKEIAAGIGNSEAIAVKHYIDQYVPPRLPTPI